MPQLLYESPTRELAVFHDIGEGPTPTHGAWQRCEAYSLPASGPIRWSSALRRCGKDHSLGQDQPFDADENICHFSGLSLIAFQGSLAVPGGSLPVRPKSLLTRQPCTSGSWGLSGRQQHEGHRPSSILGLGYTKASPLTSPGKISLVVFWAPRRREEDLALTPKKRPGPVRRIANNQGLTPITVVVGAGFEPAT